MWNLKADKLLREKLGFTPLDADRCVYVWKRGGRMVIVTLYVDDMFLFTPRGSELLPKLKKQLCLPEEGYKATAADTLRYQKAMGELNYLVGWTRPDIAFAVSALSKSCSNPSPQHFAGLRHVHRYLRGTQDHGITYRGAGDIDAVPKLTIYSDSDYAACTDDRRSVTGYSVHLGGVAVSWLSTRQRTTAQSTVEAEYMASAEAVKEAVWWRAFLRGLGHKLDTPTVLYSDNQGSIASSCTTSGVWRKRRATRRL